MQIYMEDFLGKDLLKKNYLTVSNVWNEMDALPLAEQHCSNFDRTAKFSRMEGNRAIFDCVN
jgi:hypothetical protein